MRIDTEYVVRDGTQLSLDLCVDEDQGLALIPPAPDDTPVMTNAKDWPLYALHQKYTRGKLVLQPSYQRGYVWSLRPELPSRLVESLLLDIPIPPVYFAEMPNGQLEVIDGQQRLTTLVRFLSNEYPLQRLERLTSLNGQAFKDLSDDHQEKILDAQIRSIIIDPGSNHDLRYEVFERLNRGAVPLNEQELRNCVYRGDFCDLLAVLEHEPIWRNIRGTLAPGSRFSEREMILRFFAFANTIELYRAPLKTFLNNYMIRHAPRSPQELDEQTRLFGDTMRNVYAVFGKNSARRYRVQNHGGAGGWETRFSVAALDIQAGALCGYPLSVVQQDADQIRRAYIDYLQHDADIHRALSLDPAKRPATLTRWFGFKEVVHGLLGGASGNSRRSNTCAVVASLIVEAQVEEGVTADDEPVNTTALDWTLSVLADKLGRGKIVLRPQYQREYVWQYRPELPSRLVESLLLDIPIPPVYFAGVPNGQLEVIDGQQRLTSLLRFLNNDFAIQKLERMPSLNGKRFRDLNDAQQEKIQDAQLRSVVVDSGRNDLLRYEVFERLNRGSMPLNEQELRTSVYRSPFCDLLAELEQEQIWRKVRGTTEPDPRFREREMILRFFAFAQRIDMYHGHLKPFLNEYMARYAPTDPSDVQRLAELFSQTMRNVRIVFGEHAGHLYSVDEAQAPPTGKWDTIFSIAALEIQAAALIGHASALVQAAAEQIREAYILYLLTNPQVRYAITRRPTALHATKTRWIEFKAQVLRILNATDVEPRFFSYELGRQLFDTRPICSICSNQIHSFDDATVDHIHPWSKGGRTSPDNAQLAHRLCNSRKSAQLSFNQQATIP